MKKNLFYVFALTAMCSCSQDEVMDLAQKQAISFGDTFVENAARAIDASYSNSNKPTAFKVFGTTQGDETNAPLVSIFNGVDVTGDGSTYSYDNKYTQYWIQGNTYKFAALVNATSVTLGDDKLPSTVTFTMPTGDQTDLLYDVTESITGDATRTTAVGFTFDHLLSKVFFTVKNTMTSNTAEVIYQYLVEDVKITNAYKTATCTVANKTWTSHAQIDNNKIVEFGNVSNATTAGNESAIAIGKIGSTDEATSNFAKLLIPGEYTGATGKLNKLNVTCKITTLLNGAAVDVENYSKDVEVTLEAGHAYNFIIEKGNPGTKIQFSVQSVNEWVTNHAGYNPGVNM